MEKRRLNTKKTIFLVLLLLFCFPAGILFLLWIITGKKAFFIGIGCLSIPFLLALLWLVLVIYSNSNPEFGEHVARVKWLPEDASNISFYKSYSYTAFEFRTSEEDFKKNANPTWNFQEIVEPEVISRYNSIIETRKYHQTFENYDHEAYTASQSRSTAKVTHGIVAKQRRSNGGGYHAVYDRDNGIAYIQTNPR